MLTRRRSANALLYLSICSVVVMAGAILHLGHDPIPVRTGIQENVEAVAGLETIDDALTAALNEQQASGAPERTDEEVIRLQLDRLQQAVASLRAIDSYAAHFIKQERIEGTLKPASVIKMRLRHEPFSVYMKWMTASQGRELLYVDGEREGKMLVNPGGWKARLVPAIELDPNGSLALAESRHPVTNAGILNLCNKLIAGRHRDLEIEGMVAKLVENQVFDKRACDCFIFEFPSKDASASYRKSVVYLDRETHYPLCVRNYGWPHPSQTYTESNLDSETLLESYSYANLEIDRELSTVAFSVENDEYNLRN